jgi:hypothetical protein
MKLACLLATTIACAGAPGAPATPDRPAPAIVSNASPAEPTRPAGPLIHLTTHGVTFDARVICDRAPDDTGYPTPCIDHVKLPELVAAIRDASSGTLAVQIDDGVAMAALVQVAISIGNAGAGNYTLVVGDGPAWRPITNTRGEPAGMVTIAAHGDAFVVSGPLDERCAPRPAHHARATELAGCIAAIAAIHAPLVGIFPSDLTIAELWQILRGLDPATPVAIGVI